MATEGSVSAHQNWRDVAAQKRSIQEQAIADFLQRFGDVGPPVDGVGICGLGHEELRELLAKGSIQAETVTIAYIRKYSLPTLS